MWMTFLPETFKMFTILILTVGREKSSASHANQEGVERRKVGSAGILYSIYRVLRPFCWGKEVTWSIFPVIPACDGEDQGIWSLKKLLLVLPSFE